jgi:hypothetical protein
MANFVNGIRVQKVWISATLPPYVLDGLSEIVNLDVDQCRRVHTPRNRANIRHAVITFPKPRWPERIAALVSTACSAVPPATPS